MTALIYIVGAEDFVRVVDGLVSHMKPITLRNDKYVNASLAVIIHTLERTLRELKTATPDLGVLKVMQTFLFQFREDHRS